MPSFEYLEDRWDDAEAEGLDPVGRLVYRSNLLGADWRITNTGGGNTSSKIIQADPLTEDEVEVLWVKGSSGDLRTAERKNFASLYQEKLLALQDVYARFDERGPKTLAEDKMPDMLPHCLFNLNPRAPSIDTPLHSFIPYKYVDHTHPVACIAIATAEDGKALTREIYGEEVVWIDWQRPGFELGLEMQRVCEAHPEAKRIMMGGHGLINWADDDEECYHLTLRLIEKAEAYLHEHGKGDYAFGGAKYEALSEERNDVLNEILEIAKLKRMPPEAELSQQIVAVIGAGSGIGKALVPRLIEEEGATVAALDLDAEAAETTAEKIRGEIGMGIGVAGTGISGSGTVIGTGCDITDRASIRAALGEVVLAYGGLDRIALTASLYVSPDTDGHISDEAWAKTFEVNTTGPFFVADEAKAVWEAQGLSGSLVVTTSANAVVPKAGSFAYDVSKSAANHLVRELAVALAPHVRVNGVAPATVVEGSSMFPRERVIASLSKYGLDYDEAEDTEALRARLADFYAERTLTKTPITPDDQAERSTSSSATHASARPPAKSSPWMGD